MKKCALVLAMTLMVAVGQNVARASVQLDLLLLVDVSGSVDSSEYALQKTGYVDAFNNALVQAAIVGTPGGIAVAYAEWSDEGNESLLVGWTKLETATDSAAFATAIAGTSRALGTFTGIGAALEWGANTVGPSGFGDSSTALGH